MELAEDRDRWTVAPNTEHAEHTLGVDTPSKEASELTAAMRTDPDADCAKLSARSLDTAARCALGESGTARPPRTHWTRTAGGWQIEVDNNRTVTVGTESGEVVATDS